MQVFDAVRTVLAVREFQDKPVPSDAAAASSKTGSGLQSGPPSLLPREPHPQEFRTGYTERLEPAGVYL